MNCPHILHPHFQYCFLIIKEFMKTSHAGKEFLFHTYTMLVLMPCELAAPERESQSWISKLEIPACAQYHFRDDILGKLTCEQLWNSSRTDSSLVFVGWHSSTPHSQISFLSDSRAKFNKNAKSRARAPLFRPCCTPKKKEKKIRPGGISACCFASGSPFFTSAHIPADVDTTHSSRLISAGTPNADIRERERLRLFRWDRNESDRPTDWAAGSRADCEPDKCTARTPGLRFARSDSSVRTDAVLCTGYPSMRFILSVFCFFLCRV